MKTILKLGPILAACAMPAFAAETITFDPADVAGNYAEKPKYQSALSIVEEEGAGLFTFRSSGGGELIMMQKDGRPLGPDDVVDIELRCTGEITFGVFLRGQYIGDPAYMAFFSSSLNGTVRLSLTKTTIESAQRPGEAAYAQKNARNIDAAGWLRLRFEIEEIVGGGVVLRASLTDQASGMVILEVAGEDRDAPLPPGGGLGFRFFANRTGGASQLDIRSITLGK